MSINSTYFVTVSSCVSKVQACTRRIDWIGFHERTRRDVKVCIDAIPRRQTERLEEDFNQIQ